MRGPSSRAQLVQHIRNYLQSRRDERVESAVWRWLTHEACNAGRHDRIARLRSEIHQHLADFGLDLYAYQRESLEKFCERGRMLLADDMGLGKTIQATAIAHLLQRAGKARRILVIAPASLKAQWLREWRNCTDVPIDAVDGPPSRRAEIYQRREEGTLVANYEQCRSDLKWMLDWAPDLVILDEGQRIKNWATKTAKAVKVLDPEFRLVLTGTPLENRLDELTSIMDWVEPLAMAPKWRLPAVHTYDDERGRGLQELDLLRRRLRPHLLRRRREDILEQLPDRTHTYLSVPMSPRQQAEHEVFETPIARLLSVARRRPLTPPENVQLMSLMTNQRIIANGIAQRHFDEYRVHLKIPVVTEASVEALDSPKLLRLRELVRGLVIEQGRKVVVFSQWRRMIELCRWAISDILGEAGKRSAAFTGAETQRQRQRNVVEFHDEPDLAVLFCSDAGGVGLNLQRAASACIHIELPWNPAVLEQRTARVHRLGQCEPVDVHHLVSEASIEARIMRAIADKRAVFDGVLDGVGDEVSLQATVGIDELGDAPPDSVIDETEEALEPVAASPIPLHVAPEPATPDSMPTTPIADEPTTPTNLEPIRPSTTSETQLGTRALERLFSGVSVNHRPNGGLLLEADPEAARQLEVMFSGMAQLMAGLGAGPSAQDGRVGAAN